MSDGPQQVSLWGDEHQELGQIATLNLGRGCAIALSRGRHPKGYAHTDPNEDATGALFDGDGWLLAVVDGHWGFAAARAALSAVMDSATSLDRSHPEEAIMALFTGAKEAVTEALASAEEARRGSRTTLTVALIRDTEVMTATLGDSYTFVAQEDEEVTLGGGGPFLGPDTDLTGLSIETMALSPGDVVVLCTDGLTRFLGRKWQQRLGEMARRHQDPEELAKLAVEAAFSGGAGDNIAIAALYLQR